MPDRSAGWVALLAVCGAVFVWLTAASLPPVVASHFGGSGAANGSMPRDGYVWFMVAVVIGVPMLLLVVSHIVTSLPGARINLPERDYWLAPERREETLSYLRAQMVRFSAMLVVFLCYVHWLVVRANEMAPPRLSNRALFGGLGVFLVYTLIWTRSMLRRFRNRSASE